MFSVLKRPDHLWVPPSLLFSGYRGLFFRGLSGRSVKLTINLHLLPRSRMSRAIYLFPLYDDMEWTRTNLTCTGEKLSVRKITYLGCFKRKC
jgi:hypothetical protein